MANALTYMKNVGKSVAYSSVKVIKDMNPVIKDFSETNASAISGTYKTIRDMKKVSKRLGSRVKDSSYYQYGKGTFDNLMSDIKTGKFYNKERIDKYDNDIGGFGEEIDMDFGSSDDLDFGSSDDFGFDDGPSSNEMMDIVGEKASNAVSNAVARSAEYIVQGTAESNRTLYNQMNIVYSGMQSSLSTINENISKQIQFSNEATLVHYENSKTFYQEITRLDQERNQYLKEIAEGVKQLNAPAPKSQARETSGYSDFVSYEGALDIGKYMQQVKKNIKNSDGGITDMLSLIVDMSGGKGMASPISALMELGLESVFKKSFGNAMENFNKSLSGLMGNALLALQKKSKGSFGGPWEWISNIFGIDTSIKTDIDTSAYEKGKIPFDGVTKKAITEVIPTYLSKILNALTGKAEDRFDYEKGKFVTVDDLRKEFSEMTSKSAERAASDLDWEVRRKKSSLSFRSKEEEKQFDEDWEAIKQYMYANQTSFNTRDKKLNGASFGLKGDLESDKNVRRLQGLLDGNPEVLRYADSMFRERENQSKRMRELEASGAGALISLFNGSTAKEITTQSQATGSKTSVAAAALSGSSVLNELVDIHKELSYIRIYGTGGSGGGGKKKRGKGGPGPKGGPSFDSFEIPRKQIQDDTTTPDDYPTLSDEEVDEDVAKLTADQKKKFKDKLKDAKGITGKISVFANSILGKVDEGIYSLIYGPKEESGQPDEKKSFISSLLQGLKGTFKNFSDFIMKDILDPLKERFSGDKIKDFLKGSFEKVFKISFDEFADKVKDKLFGKKDENGKRTGAIAKFFDSFKSEMKGAFGWVKDAFKGAGKKVADFAGASSVKTKAGQAKADANDTIKNNLAAANDLKKLFQSQASDITEAATGLKRVNKTGLAVISEGEMILPPDMNPFNVSKRRKNERKVKKDLKSGIDSIFEFAEGTPSADFSDDQKTSTQDNLFEKFLHQNPELLKKFIAKKGSIKYLDGYMQRQESKKQKMTKDDYERTPLYDRILDEAGRMVSSFKNAADTFGMSDEDKENFKEKATKFIGEVKEHGATMAAGATIGAGVSLITGLVGGPLLGAAVGAGVGLLTKSKSVQDFLFGNEEEGKEGALPKKLVDGIKKYAPDMAKGGAVGGLLAALPFIPGGPIAGLLVGSAVGFAQKNETIQKLIWGEDMERKEQFQKKLQSSLPKMGLGAAVGLLAGPFGPVANILLGSALGFASDSDKFKNMIFGEDMGDGKREGGLFGFIKEKILAPLEHLIDPLKRRLEDLGKYIKDTLNDLFEKKIKEPIAQFVKNSILNPLKKTFSKLFGGLLNVAKKVVAKPFEWIGNLGTNMRISDIKQGKARYMSAAEREDMRLAYGDTRFRKVGPGKDQFAEFDKSLMGANSQQLSSAQQVLEGIQGSHGDIKQLEKDSYKNIYNTFYHNKDKALDTKEGNRFSRTALRMIKSGDYEAAKKFVQDSKFNVSDETRSSLLKVIEDNANKLKTANKMRNNVTGATDDAVSLLQEAGINVDKGLIEKVQKGDKGARKTLDQMITYIKNEAGLRSTEEEQSSDEKKKAGELSPTEEATAKRHEEILNPVKSIDEKITEFLQRLTDYGDQSKYKKAPEGVTESDNEFEVTDPEVGKFTKGLNKVRGAVFDTKVVAKKKAGEIAEDVKEKAAEIKENINEARDNSEFMNKHFGVRSKRQYYKVKRRIPVAVSKGETVVSETDGNPEDEKKNKLATTLLNKGKDILSGIGEKAEEHAEGGIAGDGGGKPSGIMQLFKKMASSLSKMAGVALASAYKDGVNVDSVDSETDTKTFFGKIKSKFGKAKSVVTQFFDGHAVKFIKDKNGDLVPDSSSAENNEYEEFQQEKEEREKGILGALSGMPSMFGGLFKKVFGEKDEKEGNIFQKILDFFTGNGKGINLGSVLKNVIPLALVGLGLSGKLDNIASKLTGGLFGSKEANSGITAETPDGKNVELKTDEKGEPIKDADGNYVAVNGKTVSGDAKTRTTKSQATMSLSSRLKYNAVRGAVTGKGSIVGAVIKKNPITKPIVKGAGKVKSGLGKVANVAMKAAKDPAAVNEVTDKILDMVTKWTGAMKKVPKLAKFADKLDDLGLELAEVIAKKLPKAGGSLLKIKDILGKTNIYVMIAMAVIDFTTGFQDASTTLKIRKENVTIPQKILCGLLRTVKNFIPVIGSFIPDSLVTDLFIKYVAGWFKIDVSALKKQRDEAQKELDDYNAENGTNYSWAEYNKKVLGNYTWTEQVWNGATKVGKGIAKGAKKVGKGIAKGAKAVGKGLKKAGGWIKDKASGVVEGVKKGVGKVADFVSDKFSDAKDIGAFALAKVKDRVKEIITGKNIESNLTIKEDDPNGKVKKIIYNVINYATALPLGMSKIIHGIFDKIIKPIAKGIKDIGTGVIGSIKNQFVSAWKGDLKAAYTESSENAESGNVLVDGISKIVNNVVKIPLTMPTLLTAGVGLLVRNFKDIIGGIKTIGSGIGTTIKNQFANAWKGNFKEIFTDKSGNAETGNGFVDGISAVINTISKFALAVPTLITARIGGMVRIAKGAIDLFKQIGPGLGKTVKNQFANAWKGNFKEIFTDTSGNAETGNKLVDTISAVINTVSKFVLAVPTLITARIGGMVRIAKGAIDLFKQIGPGIGTTVKNQFANAWKGNFKEIFTDKSGNAETGNKLVDGISAVINTVSKIVLAVPTLITARIGGMVRVAKGAINLFKQIGPGIGTTVKNQFKHAWNGDFKEIFTDTSGNAETGNKLVDGISGVINTVSKIVLAVPTLITARIGGMVRGVKQAIDFFKQIGPGIGMTVKNQFKHAWNGDFKQIFTDTSGNANTGNKLVDISSAVINTVSKILLATPTLMTASIGGIVRGVKGTIDLFKQIGPGIGTTVKNQFSHAWNGEIGAIFTDTSGNANTGNKLVDTSSAVINTVSKIVLAVPTLLTAGVGGIVTGVKGTIEAIKAIGPGIGGTVKNMFSYAAAGDVKSIFTDSSENAESGNKLVDGISKVVNNIVKIPLAVPALITAGVTSAVKGITKLVKGMKKAGTLSEKDKSIIKDSKEGKVSLFSSEYWKTHTELDGIGGAFNKFVSITRKIFNIPAALIGWIKDKMPFDDFITGIKDFFGLDDSETKEKKNGSGSGLVGRGSGSQSKEQASVSDGTFISQVDPKYRNKTFNISKDTEVQTLGNTGCAPAAAAMAVNATYNDQKLSMEQASKNALKYKVTNDGVNASYFNDEFSRHGLSAEYIVSNDKNARTQEIMNRLSGNTRVVLMGQDSYNKSKAHSPFGPNPHYVVANGLSKDGKYIYINDPEASTPNIKYPTDKVLGSSTLGISAQAAMGSKLILNKVKGFVGRGAYGPETTEYKVWTKLRSAGYSEVQAAAIMGNIKHESGFRADAIEKGSGVGFGLCQWSYGRRTAIENYAKSIGKSPSDIGVQLDFLIAELTPGGGAGGYAKYQLMTTTYEGKKWQKDLFNTTTDVETATKAFCYCWERPNEKYAHIDRRVTSAKEYFKEFTGVDAPYTGDTSGSTSEGGNDFIGGVGKIFNLLASKYGLNVGSTDSSSSGDSSGGTTQTAEGNVSSNADHAAKQKALVEKMYSVQGKLIYAQGNAKFPGSRNPEDGSGDCSSTVQWAYKNILGVDPGSWTGAQRTDGDTYTVATTTADESKLQLGDLLLKDGHVEMYAGNGKMIGHGGGNDGKTKGPTVKNLDKTGKYNLVRRWVGFKGSGSGLVGRGSEVHPEPSYNMALKHIKTDEMTSILPFGMNADEISQNKSSVMQYNNNKLSGTTSNKPVAYTGRASQITNEDKRVVKKSSNETLLLEAINSIIKLLVKMVTNTDKLNNIFKLLGEYIETASNKNVSEDSKRATLIAKQNLLNSLQSNGSSSGPNVELQKLIESVERIAME